MLEFFTKMNEEDAITILKNDHDKVKGLFEEFEKAEDLRTKKKIAAEAIMELKIHAEIEEKIFYPFVRNGVEKDLMNEADEEHHVAKLLIAELDNMDATESHWEAKFTVLAENIRHHIREEEGEMLPQARHMDLDFEEVGRRLLAMKEKLKENGVPPSDEEKMIMRGTKADSPAKAAKTRLSLAVSRTERSSRLKTAKKASSAKTATKKKAAAAKKPTRRAHAKR